MKSQNNIKPSGKSNIGCEAPKIKKDSERKFPGLSHLERPITLPVNRVNESIGFGRFSLTEPLMHAAEHHLPHLKPSNSMRVGAALLSGLAEDTLQKSGAFVSLPKDPFKFVTNQNIKVLQNAMHGAGIVYATWEGMHLAHQFDVNPWAASGAALSAAVVSNYSGLALGKQFIALPHHVGLLKSISQVCAKSTVVGAATMAILESPLTYYHLKEKNYSSAVSAVSSAAGALIGVSAGVVGLNLIEAGFVPTPASPFLITGGLVTIYFSGDIGRHAAFEYAESLEKLTSAYGLMVDQMKVNFNKPKQPDFKAFKPSTVPFTSPTSTGVLTHSLFKSSLEKDIGVPEFKAFKVPGME